MSGCNCKSDKNVGGNNNLNANTKNEELLGKRITSYILKSLAFLLFLVISPIVMVVIIWFVFKTLVLNTSVDIKPLLMAIGTKFMSSNNHDDDYEDYDTLTEDDVVLTEVDNITNRSK